MCSQCEDCIHCKFIKGAVRGIMDCDPDEYYCDANEDMYFFGEDEEIKSETIAELEEEGIEYNEDDVEVNCPSYRYGGGYEDDYYPPEPPETW